MPTNTKEKSVTKKAASTVDPSVKHSSQVSFPQIKRVAEEFRKESSASKGTDYAEIKSKYLGASGLIPSLIKGIAQMDQKDRPMYGKQVNELKNEVETIISTLKQKTDQREVSDVLTSDSIDVTAPFAPNTRPEKRPRLLSGTGTLHPITTVGERALRIWELMGFHITEARRLDDDYHNFESLNFPIGHPARDMFDTFWTEENLIPITHTSSMQNRILKGVKPPIREVIVGKCFRHEETDASHEHTFYQSEGVYVSEGATLADLIGTLVTFINTFYGRSVKYRIQPSYFPFVEPGLEMLVECMICGQQGCPFCGYSGWIELVPCGMIHPNVIKEGGLDPQKYSGYAWAFGFDRLVMLRSQIEDIRNIHSGDLKFLQQFR